ncbi:hypothetical protein LCI18_000517 [Fusarium solani-melongenae]|uniref:Uncharacterized protein n=1 Tax=Fusarium solani subsp. cucurbitae TaxID=2747967 RepID=A0ACD3YKS0_FUSSC|nr:hypothetical protein LCI18_000517 [Fusarium solani-melongenae]
MKRRQNLSCEQCRASKKACDGFQINAMVQTDSTPDTPQSSPGTSIKPLPCSYCVRTKKHCSLHDRWLEARFLLQLGPSPQPSDGSPPVSDESPHSPKRKLEESEHSDDVQPVHHISETEPRPSPHDSPCPPPTTVGGGVHTDGSSLSINDLLNFAPMPERTWLDFLDMQTLPPGRGSISHGPNRTKVQEQATSDGMESVSREIVYQGNSLPATPEAHAQPPLAKRARYSPVMVASQAPLSEFDLQTTMMQISNKRLITKSLLKIYHDVLESNLACWLTERTCPYTRNWGSREKSVTLSPQSTISSSSVNTLSLNRFYTRVLRLDRAMMVNNLISLTASQDRAASKALNQVIMAFSSQWSQNYSRKEQHFGRDSTFCDSEDDFLDSHNDDFERDFQRATWHQARAALLEVSEIECYRVVYAEILFSWTEKLEQPGQSGIASDWTTKQGMGDDDPLSCSFVDLLGRGGPPVCIERAARKIQVLKFKLDAVKIGSSRTTGARRKASNPKNSFPNIGPEEQATARLLYWLAVMCDTVSSSTNERPLIIREECCDGPASRSRERSDTVQDPSFDSIQTEALGELEFLETDKLLRLDSPSAHDLVFEVITKSVPVKVLLFRKVSSLQNALRQGNHEQVNNIIQGSIATYRRWNVTYGAFFRELAQMYSSLSARIKGCFICIVIPWHLAVMLMADLIDFADSNGVGKVDTRAARLESQITSRMRRSTAVDIAELAKLTCPATEVWGGNTPTEQLPGYHFAVKSSAILTEPWTILLIGAFRNAAVYHLGIVEDLRQNDWQALGHAPDEMREAEVQVKHCIDALWLLGRRSDMSYALAKLLSQRLSGQ